MEQMKATRMLKTNLEEQKPSTKPNNINKKGAMVEKKGVDGVIVSVGKATETLFLLPCDASIGMQLMGATRWCDQLWSEGNAH